MFANEYVELPEALVRVRVYFQKHHREHWLNGNLETDVVLACLIEMLCRHLS